ncbi:hypothetical protein IFM89_008717 [Coptis chinensis]|uniref:Uncharacterized protein n=1 Tax=Coptis chinensis TaxID=261450 RepID=A0A835GXH0_9MAGN|nr:hypothetical protein IFM89_008717 [Coptis chinensis]
MSEYANKKTRGAFIAAVFAMQGFGILAGRIVGIIVSSAFNGAFAAPSYLIDPKGLTVPQADYVWLIILMVGAIPAALTYYWRMKMPETALLCPLWQKTKTICCRHVEGTPEALSWFTYDVEMSQLEAARRIYLQEQEIRFPKAKGGDGIELPPRSRHNQERTSEGY